MPQPFTKPRKGGHFMEFKPFHGIKPGRVLGFSAIHHLYLELHWKGASRFVRTEVDGKEKRTAVEGKEKHNSEKRDSC